MIHEEALQKLEESRYKELTELYNYFQSDLADMIVSILHYCGFSQEYHNNIRCENLFAFFKDFKEVEKDSGPGLYIFFDLIDMDIKYIGTTKSCLRTRILKHENYKNDSIIFIGCKNIAETVMRDIEKALILLIKPKRNKIAYIRGKNTR